MARRAVAPTGEALLAQEHLSLPAEADWAPIRRDYEEGALTQAELVAKYRISHSALNWRIKRDLWRPRYRSRIVDRPLIIARMFRLLERQVRDLENEMDEMSTASRRSGDKEVALLGKLAGNLEKLMQLDARMAEGKAPRRNSKQIEDLRSKLIERIEQLKR